MIYKLISRKVNGESYGTKMDSKYFTFYVVTFVIFVSLCEIYALFRFFN